MRTYDTLTWQRMHIWGGMLVGLLSRFRMPQLMLLLSGCIGTAALSAQEPPIVISRPQQETRQLLLTSDSLRSESAGMGLYTRRGSSWALAKEQAPALETNTEAALSAGHSPNRATKPTLYFLGIGTGAFAQPSVVPALPYVDDDVRGMLAWAQDQEGKVFGDVITEVLIGSDATRANILAALSSFGRKDETGEPVRKDDLVVVYFAGHGVVDTTDNAFYLLTWDIQSHDVRNNALAQTDLIARLMEDAGDRRSVLLILDTCHSGAVVNRTFQQLVRTPSTTTVQERGAELNSPAPAQGVSVSTRPGGEKAAPQKKATSQKRPAGTTPSTTPAAVIPAAQGTQLPTGASLSPVAVERGLATGSAEIERVRSQADPRQLWAVYSAASELQKAKEGAQYRHPWESADIEGHGVFTWALLGALRSHHADTNRDGRITLQELEKDVLTQVRRVGGQEPALAGKQADRELAYARGAIEECDGKDNNFDGVIDEGFADRDRDGQADCLRDELCNGIDDNGNGIVDEGFDFDNDGFLNRNLCPAGIGQDCNDKDPAISPIAQDPAERKIRWITDNN